MAASAPMWVENSSLWRAPSSFQGERRALLSVSIDPVRDREFGGRLSFDALGHVYARNPDCREVQPAGCGLATPSRRGIAVKFAGKAMISITACNARARMIGA
jgi:hypothetical protein